jgi:hypothetical protein
LLSCMMFSWSVFSGSVFSVTSLTAHRFIYFTYMPCTRDNVQTANNQVT